MTEFPKITVLMTLYNGGGYLRQSVQSILNQTHKDFEFLIINDGSTDHSVEVVRSFNDGRIRIHHNPENLGQTKSLNIGLELAAGDYIARIDADDVALPQWLQEQIDFIREHPDCSVVSAYVFAIDENNKIKKLYKPPCEQKDIILRSLITSPVNHVGSVFKKKDILENGGYDKRYKTAADFDLWGKLLRNGFKITTTPKILVAIREHAQSLSRSERGMRELVEIEEIIRKNLERFVDLDLMEDESRLFCRINYDEGRLTDDEFHRAIKITRKIYAHLVPLPGFTGRDADQWIRKRCITLFVKRIFFCINQKKYSDVRKLSLEAMREFGHFSVFMILWGASICGGMILNVVPDLYSRMLRFRTRIQLNGQVNLNIFH